MNTNTSTGQDELRCYTTLNLLGKQKVKVLEEAGMSAVSKELQIKRHSRLINSIYVFKKRLTFDAQDIENAKY